MQDAIISLLGDLAKVGGGAFSLFFIQWLTTRLNRVEGKKEGEEKKINGTDICKEHLKMAETVIASHNLLKSMHEENKEARRDAKEERRKLFDKTDGLETDFSQLRTDFAVLKTKVKYIETDSPLPAKEISNKQFLVLDDQVAESTCKIIESYFGRFATCVPAKNIDEAMKLLENQVFDFCIIDLFLNDVQNGFEFGDYCEKSHPKMNCIIYSGKKPEKIPTRYIDRYIEKPFIPDEFIKIINEKL